MTAFAISERLRPRVRALETLKARLRHVGVVLLDFEMWERWGASMASDADRARMESEATAAMKERVSTEKELEALVTKLRRESPESIDAWADAHDTLLAAFIERYTLAKDPKDAEIGRSVANGERAQWAEVRRGERAFVHENTYYVHVDADRYRALFDMDP